MVATDLDARAEDEVKPTKLTPVRIAELRDCRNPVFDELLDVLEAQTEVYEQWLLEVRPKHCVWCGTPLVETCPRCTPEVGR